MFVLRDINLISTALNALRRHIKRTSPIGIQALIVPSSLSESVVEENPVISTQKNINTIPKICR
jgi:hypothetical protein